MTTVVLSDTIIHFKERPLWLRRLTWEVLAFAKDKYVYTNTLTTTLRFLAWREEIFFCALHGTISRTPYKNGPPRGSWREPPFLMPHRRKKNQKPASHLRRIRRCLNTCIFRPLAAVALRTKNWDTFRAELRTS